MNYSGFDTSKWTPRNIESHHGNVEKVQKCSTKTERALMESKLGCRYSALLQLPYFDPIEMLVVDPMHNLFLGTAKHMLKLWLKNELISKNNFDSLQNVVDSIVVPSEVGRVPYKIKNGFSGFTADQFKNWVTLYSIPALYDYLPTEHLECWRHFVLACRILCQHSVTYEKLQLAHVLLIQFCKRVEILYGEQAVTPNMHMHGHLIDVMKNFGPCSAGILAFLL